MPCAKCKKVRTFGIGANQENEHGETCKTMNRYSKVKKIYIKTIEPILHEVKRLLCWLGMGEFDFNVRNLEETKFRCHNRTEVYRSYEFGGELAALAAFHFLIRPEDVVWDVGASIGLFSVHNAKKARKVLAFEPDPKVGHRCRQNVIINGLSGKVEVLQLGLADRCGKATLYTDGARGRAPSLADAGSKRSSVEICIETIDNLIDKKYVAPAVLKIDIEGAEALVLRGAKRLLQSPEKPRLLFIEVHPQFLPKFDSTEHEINSTLKASGYIILATQRREAQYHLIAVRDC